MTIKSKEISFQLPALASVQASGFSLERLREMEQAARGFSFGGYLF